MQKNILRITLMSLSCLLSGVALLAQSFYNFSNSTAPYTEISGGTVVSSTLTSNNYLIQLPHPLTVFNAQTGTSLAVGRNAYITTTGPTYSFAFDALTMALSKMDNTSSISYTIAPAANDSVLIIQWKNMKLDSGNAGDYINMQCKIYFKSQAIEFHYGPGQTTSPRYADSSLDNLIGVFLLSQDFNTAFDYNWIYGNSNAPLVSNDPQKQVWLLGLPANGTVYRFTRKTTGIAEYNNASSYTYPNPAADILYVTPGEQPGSALITDITGKTIQTPSIINNQVDISELAAGVYFLHINNSIQKFIKQ